ncbi:MAG: phenylalanine--tRNA ligase subunit beta [Candidatus Omnitrophota bacterium]
MKVTYNWLKDFVDIKIPARKLAERLTMAGLEATSLEERGDDVIFELEVTSNRPDWLSVIGIAREIAAITNSKCRAYSVKRIADSKTCLYAKRYPLNAKTLKIDIEDKKDCPLYTARVIKGVKVRPSPDWLQNRLELVGLRPVNNIVDITNYVLMETGQPLHTFDLNKIKHGAIFVRRAKGSERIVTIDGKQHDLNPGVLVIADRERPVAIAGIMGGRDTEVSRDTEDILLEAAVFDPIVTRRASRVLGLSSDSSYRFERGVDVQAVESASIRAAGLITELAGGRLILSRSGPKPKLKKTAVALNGPEVSRMLGAGYSSVQIKKLLASLGFSIKQAGRNLKVEVPCFRADVSQPVDLIEEIARISGYDNIPAKLPRIIPQQSQEAVLIWNKVRTVRDILISQGADEVITYSLINRSFAYELGFSDSQLIAVANPLTSQQEILRPSLIFGLISSIEYNLNQKQKDIRIFEISKKFQNGRERLCLGLACSGKESNILHIKGMLGLLLKRLGIAEFEFTTGGCGHLFFHKDASLSLMVDGKLCADLGMVKPEILEKSDIKDLVFAAEADLESIFSLAGKARKKYAPVPLFPEVARDVSIALKQEIPVGNVIKRVKAGGIPHLVEITFKEFYLGKQIPPGHKGLTLSCVYRAADRTLTTEEAESAHQKVLGILTTEFFARLR